MGHGSVGSSCDLEELRHMGESLRLVLPWVDWLREPGMRNLEAVAGAAADFFFGGNHGKPVETLHFFMFLMFFFAVYDFFIIIFPI